MSRTQRSAWSVANGLVFTLVSLSIGVVATPLLLSWLGSERFGTYRVLLDWLGYISLFEFGIGGALLARLAVAVGRNDVPATRRLIASGLHVYFGVTLAMVISGIAWVTFLPRLISTSTISNTELRNAALIMLTLVLLTPLSVFRVLAEARQRSYIINMALTVQSVLITGLMLLTAWIGWRLIGQAFALVIVQVFTTLFLIWDGIRVYRGLRLEQSNRETVKDIWSLNWPTFILNLSGRTGLLTDNIIIGWVLGPAAVTGFFLTQRLATIALNQMQYIGNATWAGLVELHVQGESETFRTRLLELTKLVSGLSLCLLGPIAAYNFYFIERWVGALNYAGGAVSLIACINVWLWGIFSLWGWPVSGTGNVRRLAPYATAFTLVNVTISIVGAILLGLIGPLLGTLVAFVTINMWALPRVLNRLFGLSPWQLWRAALAPLVWGVPYVTLTYVVARSHSLQGWFGLILEMMMAGMVGLALWWTFSLSRSDRAIWLARVRSALGR